MFEGGVCHFQIRGTLTYDFTSNIPAINPQQSITVTKTDIRLAETGFVALQNFRTKIENERPTICKDSKGDLMDSNHAYPFLLASREELYQKYSVVIALFFSILATILTIINVLIAIFD